MADRWWQDKAGERYWLEATDREDIGADLRAPDADASGRDNWRYTLFKETTPGDVVFHYDSRAGAIVGWSHVSGPWEPQPIVWAARGSYARERHAEPVEVPGYRVPLADFTQLAQPVTLEQLRGAKRAMAALVTREVAGGKHPLYFPFELSNRDVRPMQGYAFKLPASFLDLFRELAAGKTEADRLAAAAQRNPHMNIGEPAAAKVKSNGQGAAAPRNPPWSRDELILALDLYMTNPSSPPAHASQEVAELSDVLSRMAKLLGMTTAGTYRNANGVYMKMMNFRRLDPNFIGVGLTGLTRGNKDEAVVWEEFAGDRPRLAAVAAAIRAAIASDEAPALQAVDDEGIEEAFEGRVLIRLHRSRERNRNLVATKKARAMRDDGRLKCEGCEFDFAEAYGGRGQGFMEAHHTRAVTEIVLGQATRLFDLALVCANCHRMIHARRPWLSMKELRSLILRTQSRSAQPQVATTKVI